VAECSLESTPQTKNDWIMIFPIGVIFIPIKLIGVELFPIILIGKKINPIIAEI
jgi:hypothetical protein